MMPELIQLRDFAKRYTGAWCSQNASSVAAFFALNGSLRAKWRSGCRARGHHRSGAGIHDRFPRFAVAAG
jgi:hypothetical protein